MFGIPELQTAVEKNTAAVKAQTVAILAFIKAIDKIPSQSTETLRLVQSLILKGEKIMSVLDDLESKVLAQTTVIDGAVVLLGTLAQEIRDAAADPARLQALADKVDADTQKLAAAITANTPAQ